MMHLEHCVSIAALALLVSPSAITPDQAQGRTCQISLVQDGPPGKATNHGWDKMKAALSAKSIRYEEVENAKSAHGEVLIFAGLASGSGLVAERIRSLGIMMPEKPESLIIHKAVLQGKPTLLLSGSDDRGLMYALLEVATRIGLAKDQASPLSEVRDTVESPSVNDRGVIIFTMQKHQYEDRLHDENYWVKYFDMLADDRFNTIEVLFAYEANGYNCPVYPYYIDVDSFPEVKVAGLSPSARHSSHIWYLVPLLPLHCRNDCGRSIEARRSIHGIRTDGSKSCPLYPRGHQSVSQRVP